MKITHVIGARPNFMKVDPVLRALAGRPEVEQIVIHTGQHYDTSLSEVMFEDLGLPQPDINLEVGSASHAVQTGQIMVLLEEQLEHLQPDWVLVYGDINSTLAAALVCAKAGVPLAHVEAGLRSRDSSMPEEINRVVTDRLANLLLTPSHDADQNLLQEGADPGQIHMVGNVMIDTLMRLQPEARSRWDRWRQQIPMLQDRYGVVTLHRPFNVDDPEHLTAIMVRLQRISEKLPLLFPVHPRTQASLAPLAAFSSPRLQMVEPFGYLDFLCLQERATLVITDSGGIQEETTWLGVPCLTLRPNTERPVTVTLGTNQLVGGDLDLLEQKVDEALQGEARHGSVPPCWDGQAGRRIAELLAGPVPGIR